MALSHEDVREILRIVDESELDELLLETDRFTLHVRRGAAGGAPAAFAPASDDTAARTPRAPAAAAIERAVPAAEDGLTIEAPMLGTFYRAEGPGKPPFVDVGSDVTPDTIVGIIEVMKMMNSVPAGVSGRVVEVFQANAELVEYGAPLFRVQPA